MNTQIIPVPFYEDVLVLVGKDNEPVVAMKPIVENMGLDWKGQHVKLTAKYASTMEIISIVAEDGKNREMTCLPLRKLPAWLYSINPNKVKPELRDKITRYQNECDDVLWNYWTQGTATRTGALSVTERLRVHRARHAVLDKLEATTHAIKRQALYEELTELSGLLGYTAPDLTSVGSTEPDEPACITELWDAITELQHLNVATNHARDSELIAINLPEVARLANEHKIPLSPTPELRRKILMSRYARYLKNTCVNSALTNKSVKCYVFRKSADDGHLYSSH